MERPEVSILIVTHNHENEIAKTIESILAQEFFNYEIVIVDCASTDSTCKILSGFPQAKIIQADRNLGYAGGMNLALAHSTGELVLFCNPDILMLPGCISSLVDPARNHSTEAVSFAPKLLLDLQGAPNKKNLPILDSTGIEPNFLQLLPSDRGQGQPDWRQFDGLWDVFGPTGALSLWRRSALDRIAIEGRIFDESFHSYFEDVDLAARARIAGYKCRYVASARAVHPRKGPLAKGIDVEARAFVNRYRLGLRCMRLGWHVPRLKVHEAARLLYRSTKSGRYLIHFSRLLMDIPKIFRQRKMIFSFSKK